MTFNIFKKTDDNLDLKENIYESNVEPERTCIKLRLPNYEIKLGNHFILSGFLSYGDNRGLANSAVAVFFEDKFVKTFITDKEGYFGDYVLAKYPGNVKIMAYYQGTWEYESALSEDYLKIVEPEQSEDSLEQLEKIVRMHEKGKLSDNEFNQLKEKIIRNFKTD